ncbi:MAG: hypothetical protein JMN25_18215 [gamma proteobacterium endosymbiont of Lamellibrachia anaximandri]|nr:hypothetical protein [gamma proteobacterium endosymbiont of Lamellibrachia anaximandri]
MQVGWKTLLNKRGMMWRKLDDDTKANINETTAIQVMLDSPSIIKRPVFETGSEIHVGFNKNMYRSIFS